MAAQADASIRKAAFDWLAEQVDLHSDVLPRSILAQGFEYEGDRVPLLGPQGIFKPRTKGARLELFELRSVPALFGSGKSGSENRFR